MPRLEESINYNVCIMNVNVFVFFMKQLCTQKNAKEKRGQIIDCFLMCVFFVYHQKWKKHGDNFVDVIDVWHLLAMTC